MSEKIVIIGGGLTGLACALTLMRLGKDFVVVDANDRVGGRVRSIARDGFVLDLGFQVLLTSYPAIRAFVDVSALNPCFFEAGAYLAYDGRLDHFQSPLENPMGIFKMLRLPAMSLADKARLGLLAARVLARRERSILADSAETTDISTEAFLRQWGFSNHFLERFARPFFGGVLLDRTLSTSAGLFQYYLRKFITGRAYVPAAGIGRLPAAMAERLPAATLRLGVHVASLQAGPVVVCADGSRIDADTVVLAVEEPAACRLLGLPPAATGRSVVVVYFESQVSLYDRRCLVLPDRGAAQHFVQITNIAPELAPRGRHLISASVVDPERFEAEQIPRLVEDQIRSIFPEACGKLTHLETIVVPYAVPQQDPGFAGRLSLGKVPERVIVAGDWMRGASVQSALESGCHAAQQAMRVTR